MKYVREELDRSTGQLVLADIGEWVTVTELGEQYGVGRKKVRAILHHMGLLANERGHYRLPRWAVEKGLGLRHDKPRKSRYAFDVISPKGQRLIAQVWDETVKDYEADLRKDARVDEARLALEAYLATRVGIMEERQRVCWLRDHFEMTHEAVAKALEISPTLARRYADQQDEQRAFWARYKKAVPAQESTFDPLPEKDLTGLWNSDQGVIPITVLAPSHRMNLSLAWSDLAGADNL